MSESVSVFTIGFTGKSAQQFFHLLISNGVRRLYDTRLNNTSQLAGFAKGKDLSYFCKAIANIEYEHRLDMAPTKELLEGYRKGTMTWDEYAIRYTELLDQRKLRSRIQPSLLHNSCFLCSEHKPDRCHRSLLTAFVSSGIEAIEVRHLW